MKGIIDEVEKDVKKLFVIDGFGAILSAFLLGFVLVRLEKYFGIPIQTLYLLALFPVIFTIYDLYCYWQVNYNHGKLLKVIALLNLLYCCLSIGAAFYHIETITSLGWIYMLVEISIVIFLALIELNTARKWINKNHIE